MEFQQFLDDNNVAQLQKIGGTGKVVQSTKAPESPEPQPEATKSGTLNGPLPNLSELNLEDVRNDTESIERAQKQNQDMQDQLTKLYEDDIFALMDRLGQQGATSYTGYDENYSAGKQTPETTLNNMTFDETLRRSRLLDAVNNRLMHSPVGIGARAVSESGISGTDLSSVLANAMPKKGEQFETEEARQMAANREMDKAQRDKELNVQQEIKEWNWTLTKDAYKRIADELERGVSKNRDFAEWVYRTISDFEYVKVNSAKLDQLIKKNGLIIDDNFKNKILRKIQDAFNEDQMFGKFVAQIYSVTMPEAQQILHNKMVNTILQDDELTPQEQMAAIYYMQGLLAQDAVYAIVSSLGDKNLTQKESDKQTKKEQKAAKRKDK